MDERVIIKSKSCDIASWCEKATVFGIVLVFIPAVFMLLVVHDFGVDYLLFGLALGLPVVLFSRLISWFCAGISLTVTDRRIYGQTFRKRVDLPLDSISAVAKGMFHAITVSTASGHISFAFIKNSDDIHDEISRLLVERQRGRTEVSEVRPREKKETSVKSAAEELREFKALLDDGIITQEEFDAKKKQLLGL